MDGLLINSEDIYTESISQVLRSHGRPEGLTWDIKIHLQGVQASVANQRLVDHYHLDISAEEMNRETAQVQETMWGKTKFLPGALKLLQYLDGHGIPIALCTSSNSTKFHQKTDHLPEFKVFGDRIITADTPGMAGRGKPKPDVWWKGLAKINGESGTILPEECLVFEDAVNGFVSGKAAGSYVIWVPDSHVVELMSQDERESLTGAANEYGIRLDSLLEFDPLSYGLS